MSGPDGARAGCTEKSGSDAPPDGSRAAAARMAAAAAINLGVGTGTMGAGWYRCS